MAEVRRLTDPFTGKSVEILDGLVTRLRGRYAVGPTLPTGEPEFGWREFDVPPIQKIAADKIEAFQNVLKSAEGALEQAQDCINGETPEDMSHEEAREHTVSRIRDALRLLAALDV